MYTSIVCLFKTETECKVTYQKLLVMLISALSSVLYKLRKISQPSVLPHRVVVGALTFPREILPLPFLL